MNSRQPTHSESDAAAHSESDAADGDSDATTVDEASSTSVTFSSTDVSSDRAAESGSSSVVETDQPETGDPPATPAQPGELGDETPNPFRTAAGELRYETQPTLRPVLVLLGSVIVGGSLAVAIPLLWPGLFGDPAIAEIVLYATLVLVTVLVVRLTVRLVVLAHTRYEIRDDALLRRYKLAYKRDVREIPLSKLRGHEYAQSRLQSSLGVGTVRLLTAGTNRSLGFLEYEHLRDPGVVRAEIQELFAKREASVREQDLDS